ncbi:MAG: endonuclease/exonuclease/phosphatase, partial [Actinomycetia bacterium]|nr:endonuclease/exonuclease/phosphatase [Actinomycetes bacterium]
MTTTVLNFRRSFALGLALATMMATIVLAGPASGADEVPIYEIQGAGHLSPYAGQTVTTTGVVTAVGFDNFYVQDPVGDGDDATSDGLFVFAGRTGASARSVGECVELTDRIDERIGGGASTGNLSTTQMA